MSNLLALIGLACLLAVSVSLMQVIRGDSIRHRLGVTILPAWAVMMTSVYLLRVTGEDLVISIEAMRASYGFGMIFCAWAIFDASRLSRQYGTTTLAKAVEVAREMIRGDSIRLSVIEGWADFVPIAIWVKAVSGEILYVNPFYIRKYGIPKGYAEGRHAHEFFGEEIEGGFNINDAEVLESGQPQIFTEKAPTPCDPGNKGKFLKFPMVLKEKRVATGGMEIEAWLEMAVD